MSTRGQVIIKDEYYELIFYRHSDSYPEGMLPILNKFIELVKDGKIRNNTEQSAGWLIILGALEYQTLRKWDLMDIPSGSDLYKIENYHDKVEAILKVFEPEDWKVGAYEPSTCIHGDIEYLYVVDSERKESPYPWTQRIQVRRQIQ
jgi:hypothetical protein